MIGRALRDRLLGGFVDVATAPVRRRSFPRPRWGADAAVEPLRILSADGTALHADVYTPRAGAVGTVVLAHGYRDGRGQLAFLARPLLARRQRVVAFDFRAHGRSEGAKVTIGAREADDVRAVLAAARELQADDGSGGEVTFLGYSMGASAYLLSGVEANVAVLDSPYDTLERAVSARVRRFGLPETVARALAAEGSRRIGVDLTRARPIERVPRLTSPTLFVFARNDAWIGAATREAFARVLPPCASLRVVPGGHRLHFGVAWRAAIVEFLCQRSSQSA
jgi:pimeloyl-ACP methyl ester carboxylesterase